MSCPESEEFVMRQLVRVAVLLLLGCVGVAAGERVPVTLVQINDVYEISPVQGGKEGGIARLATLRRQLRQENPRTFLVLAGDVFSPSALGTAEVDGKPVAGAQMVAALNAAGLDYATFGNHEFDIPEKQFYERLKESRAVWFSGNVRDREGKPFPGVRDWVVFTVRGAKGGRVEIGLIGLTLNANQQPWVSYRDVLETAREQAKALRPKVDILIAVTHLALEQDQQLAAAVPELDLILGGHEHENWQLWRGGHFTPIYKADANARSVYIHRLVYDTQTKKLRINSTLRRITPDIPEDAATAKVVREWTERAYQGFRANGFDPGQVVAQTTEAFDGKESSVRNHSTALTELVAQAMLREWPEANAAIFNAGSIRIDDEIAPGPITQYDIIRILPFGGKVLGVEMKGSLLARLLEAGRANRGKGGFLHAANAARSAAGNSWLVAGQPLDLERTYRIAISDFLMSGMEGGIEFLTRDAAGVGKVTELRDIRFAVIEEIQRRWGGS
jgi:5'-nucleotidase / UDP-sugar diphosphatase